jgi:hypothetical protein
MYVSGIQINVKRTRGTRHAIGDIEAFTSHLTV